MTVKKIKKIVWFALKSKRGREDSLIVHLKTHSKVLDVLIFWDDNSNLSKKAKMLWPGMIFVKTYLVNKNIDKDLQQFIINSSDFSRFFAHGRSYWVNPILMSEQRIQSLIKQVQTSSEVVASKFSADQIDFKVNDVVTILKGVFRGCEGEVKEINFKTGVVTVNTEFFGRITPIQVGFLDCKKTFS